MTRSIPADNVDNLLDSINLESPHADLNQKLLETKPRSILRKSTKLKSRKSENHNKDNHNSRSKSYESSIMDDSDVNTHAMMKQKTINESGEISEDIFSKLEQEAIEDVRQNSINRR